MLTATLSTVLNKFGAIPALYYHPVYGRSVTAPSLGHRWFMTGNVEIPKILRCLLTVDQETGRWLGHCLDFDIVTSGKDEDRAWKNLVSVVRLHVEHCFTHWQDGLKFHADENCVALFEALKQKQEMFRSEKVTFNLIPPTKTEHLAPLWMQGVEWVKGVGVGTSEGVAVQ